MGWRRAMETLKGPPNGKRLQAHAVNLMFKVLHMQRKLGFLWSGVPVRYAMAQIGFNVCGHEAPVWRSARS